MVGSVETTVCHSQPMLPNAMCSDEVIVGLCFLSEWRDHAQVTMLRLSDQSIQQDTWFGSQSMLHKASLTPAFPVHHTASVFG